MVKNKIYENILGINYIVIFLFLIIFGLSLISSTKEVLTGIVLILIGIILAIITRKYWLKWSIYSDPK